MSDAAPLGDADLYIEPLKDGRFLVNGNARLDDLSEHLGFELEADGIDTIGGLVFYRLGYLPPSGTASKCRASPLRFGAPRRSGLRRSPRKNCLLSDGDRPEERARLNQSYAVAILCLWTVSFCSPGSKRDCSRSIQCDSAIMSKRKPSALRLERLTKRPERLLITVLLVTNLANILGLLLLTKVLVASFGAAGFFWQ